MDPRGNLADGQTTKGITLKVWAGRDGGLSWTAAAGVGRKRQLCKVSSRLTWFGPWEKEAAIFSRRGNPGRDTGLKENYCTNLLYIINTYLVFITLELEYIWIFLLPHPTLEPLRERILCHPSLYPQHLSQCLVGSIHFWIVEPFMTQLIIIISKPLYLFVEWIYESKA